ncbi:MAG TPA: AzlD domain-containing protein [Trueperaceae bacterium]
MNATLAVLLMAVVTYGPRLLGFALSGRDISPFWLRFLEFVPIAVFSALIVPALPGGQGELNVRLVAAALAGLVMWRVRNLWLGIAVGMAAFWLFRAL